MALASEESVGAELRKRIEEAFAGMMSALYREEGASLRIGILAEPEAQEFIEAHAGALDSSFEKVEMSDLMRRRLQRSDYIFSGMKAFHELNEAFPSLLDENGDRKPFERFLNDVRKIDKTYNSNYLRSEYNFVLASAEMAGKWEGFMQDGDRYYLQYRTARDGRVRPEHAALHGVTLPITDTFWEEFYPPNGWNCRCTVVQVRKSRYPATPHDEAMALGEQALQRDTKGMFRFNPGREEKAVPDYNPYTIGRCRDCDIAKGKFNLAKKVFIPDNELCQACQLLQMCAERRATVYKYGKGIVKINNLVNPGDSDYADLVRIAENFAKEGTVASLTPKMSRPPKFRYECIYGDLVGTKYEGKCPDLNIDGKWYEFEEFTTANPKRALKNMLNNGLKQSNRLIIKRPDLAEWYIKHNLLTRIKNGQDIQEVWLMENDGSIKRIL